MKFSVNKYFRLNALKISLNHSGGNSFTGRMQSKRVKKEVSISKK